MSKSSKGGGRFYIDEPNMSDLTLLVSVEDLINIAMGPAEQNTVNYKMVQSVLYILARQMRVLRQEVKVSISDDGNEFADLFYSPSKNVKRSEKAEKARLKEERAVSKEKERAERSVLKDQQNFENMDTKENDSVKEKENTDIMTPVEKKKYIDEKEKEEKEIQKMSLKEKEEYFRDKVGKKQHMEKITRSEKEKYVKDKENEKQQLEKMTPEERKNNLKEKELEEKELQNMSPKEKEKYLKEKEQEGKELQNMSFKEKDKYLKEKEKEEKELEKMSPIDRERYLKDKERENQRMEKITPTEKDNYHKTKERENKDMEKISPEQKKKYLEEKEIEEKLLQNMSPKEKEKYLKEKDKEPEKNSPKDQERYFKDKEREKQLMEKMTPTEKENYYKTKERANKMTEKNTPEEKKKYPEEKEREEQSLQHMSSKDKEKYFKVKEEERELEKMPPIEQKSNIKENQKDNEDIENTTHEEKKKYVKDKNKKDTEKISRKEKKQYAKETEKEERHMEKMASTEKKQYLQDKEKEQEGLQKLTRIEKEQYLKEKQIVENSTDQKRGRAASGTSIASVDVPQGAPLRLFKAITITELRSHGSGIDIVTQSKFRLLEDVVMELKKKAGPLPMPTLPDSKQLKEDLATGRASLTDTMEAMQVSVRMQAAEQAVGRLAKMLTQLAAAGVLPEEFALNLEKVKADMAISTEEQPSTGAARKSVAIDPLSTKPSPMGALPSDGAAIASRASVYHGLVWQDQMEDVLQMMKDDLMQKIQKMSQRATITAEAASFTTKAIVDNFDAVMKMNDQINALYSLSTDCDAHLTGFNSAFKIQMQSLNEEMVVMKNELKGALVLLTSASRHPESPVVVDLKERYKSLTTNLDEALVGHQDLTKYQRQLDDELHSLMDLVEMLREVKADRDEMLDGLRDKAENSKLDGLVSKKRLESIRMDIEIKLRACYNKFSKQKATWMSALQDLSATHDSKAEVTDLLTLKANVKEDLLSTQHALEELATLLAEPKAALLIRLLSKHGDTGPCKVEGRMITADPACQLHLPLGLRPLPQIEPCAPKWYPQASLDFNTHLCKRWVGGSHTLLCSNTPREVSLPLPPPLPLGRYIDYGNDGKPYKMAKDLLPCIECNKPPPPHQCHKYDIPKTHRDGGRRNKHGLTTKLHGRVCECLFPNNKTQQ